MAFGDWFKSKEELSQILGHLEAENTSWVTVEDLDELANCASIYANEEMSKSDIIWRLDGYRQIGQL